MITPPLRILMFIPHLGTGGAEGSFLRLAEFLARHAEVSIALMTGEHAEAPDALRPVVLDGGRHGGGKPARWRSMLGHLRELKDRHDVTISFLSGANLLNALAGSPERTIISERGSKRSDTGMRPVQRFVWTRALDRIAYHRAGRIVTASEGLAHEITMANPWARDKVVAIEGTVRADELVANADAPIEPEFQELARDATIVSFGRLHVQKGFDFLLRVVARLRARRPDVRLLLLGDGDQRAPLEALAQELGLVTGPPGSGATVVFGGMRPIPHRYARLGRAVAFPSRFEGLPNAVIEAVASGMPVMAADCRWGPRTILSGGALGYATDPSSLPMPLQNGVLMPRIHEPGALEAWVDVLGTALDRPARRRPPEERLAAISRYDIRRTGPEWLDLVRELADRKDCP